MSRCRRSAPVLQSGLFLVSPVVLVFFCCGCGMLGRPGKPTIDDERNPLVVIETSRGRMTAELDERDANNAVNYFLYLVENSQTYVNRPIYEADYRSVYAGPQAKPLGFTIRHERATHWHKRGALSIKGDRNGTLTADIVIMRGNSHDFDSVHTVIGHIVSGMRTLDRLAKGDVIKRIYVKRKKSHAYVPTVRSDGPIRTGDF
ncbi:MAG: hypothetical protein GXP25_18840 [Planctomycetes bacterium]|nr:hypothetical protein [Planctomycetota bacterium]